MCFSFGESATGRDKYYYREEIFPSRPVSYRDRDRDHDGDWDRHSTSTSYHPARSSYHSSHHHHHRSDHHHHHGHHHRHYRGHSHTHCRRDAEIERYSYYPPSARSTGSLTTTNGHRGYIGYGGYGNGYGTYGNACIPMTEAGAGRFLRDSNPVAGAAMATTGAGRRGSNVSETLLIAAHAEQGPVPGVYERTMDEAQI